MPVTCTLVLNKQKTSVLSCPGTAPVAAFSGTAEGRDNPDDVAMENIGPLRRHASAQSKALRRCSARKKHSTSMRRSSTIGTCPYPCVSSRTMRNVAYLLLSITLASPLSALAFGNDNPDYDQCILLSLRNSQSRMAAGAIRDSCDALYRNGALLLPRERSYHVCVLQNVQSVRDAFAVNEILHACRRQNQM